MDKQEVFEQCARDSVAFVRLQFTEPYGAVKNVSIPVDELEKALDNELMFDGSSIRGFKRIEQSDMYFLPDPATYAVLPWRGTESARTARLICDVADPDGQPVRRRSAHEPEARAQGGRRPGLHDERRPRGRVLPLQARRRRQPDRRPARRRRPTSTSRRSTAARTAGATSRSRSSRWASSIEAAHHEVAIGQHEIDFRHADALATADNLITFRMVVKTIAARHGMHATFMAKPIHGENGSGMHIEPVAGPRRRERVP